MSLCQVDNMSQPVSQSHMRWPINVAISSLSHRHIRSLLRSYARRTSLRSGKALHAALLISGRLASSPESFLANALLHLYASSGIPSYAHKVFDEIPDSHKDAADWTAMMVCLARRGGGGPRDALWLFARMRRSGVEADDVALVSALNACARLEDAKAGPQVHCVAEKAGFGAGSVRARNAVMDMYVKLGSLAEARLVFDGMAEKSVVSWTVVLDGTIRLEGSQSGRVVFDAMPERNAVAWTVMLAGYVSDGFTAKAFSLLDEMVFGSGPRAMSHVTLCSVLSASARSGDLTMGKWVHVYAFKTMGTEIDIMVETALVDMYSKCGRIDAAMTVVTRIPAKNIVTWNAMLSGLAAHGKGKTASEFFLRMIGETEPDELTFTSLLSGFSHSGLVEEGREIFLRLESSYGVKPEVEHYACMVDLLGRAGRLEEAVDLISRMPMPPNEVVLGSLLGSCRVHGNSKLGERALKELVRLNPNNTECHVLVSNMYTAEGELKRASSVRRGIRKVPGTSSIRVGGQVHRFSAGDRSHPMIAEVYAKLGEVIRRLRSAGYVPELSCQVFSGGPDSAPEEIEQALFSHSEKLAVCFGLMSTRDGSSLYVFKNLRICLDCHNAMKIVSEVYNREIVVRDRNRFHCFKKGSCSCSDYW